MKKAITISAIMAMCLVSNAQKGFHLGYKVAPQSVWMFNGDNSDNASYRYISTWGVAHGLNLAYFFKPTIGAGFDLIFSTQGQKFEVAKESPFTNHLKMKYLKLPILLHFSTDPESPVMFAGQFGPQFAFLTNAEVEVEQTPPGTILLPGKTYDVKSGYETVNIGWVLGFGIGTNFGTDFLAMTLQLRFDFGFTDAENKLADDDLTAANLLDPNYYYYYSSSPNFKDRPSTLNATGGIELGLKYILRTDK